MDVLNYLVLHQGELVAREALERDVWRGALVGYDSVTSTIIKLRRALGDDAHNPKYIETVPKRGYRLIASVEQPVADGTGVSTLEPGEAAALQIRSRGKKTGIYGVLSLLIVFIVGIALILLWQSGPKSSIPSAFLLSKPSIVVIPFENLSDDPEQDYFSYGMSEDIITDLSRLSHLRVIASKTLFAHINSSNNGRPHPQEIGEEFNVEYILEGSVRRSGDALRVNARLVDTRSGFQIWASRYDRRLSDLFTVQDELTGNIVEALALRLTPNERALLSRKTTDNLQAYDLFLEGQRLSRINTRESIEAAQSAYRRAIGIDPGYGRAYGALAYNMALGYRRGWTDRPLETLTRALELAKQGVALDNSIPQTYWSLGFVYMMHRAFANAEEAARNAIVIAPNFGDGYGLLAQIHNNLGEAQKAIDMVAKGKQVNPYFTWDYLYSQGKAYYLLDRYEKAIASLTNSLERNEFAIVPRLYLAACYVRVGRLEDAEWEIDQIRILNSTSTITHTRNALPIEPPEMMNALLDDLRQAGLPE